MNRKPDQEEEKEVGRGGAGSPASDQRGENEDNEWRIFSVLFEKLLLRTAGTSGNLKKLSHATR